MNRATASLVVAIALAAFVRPAAAEESGGGPAPIGPCLTADDYARIEAIVAAAPRLPRTGASPEGVILYADPMGGTGTNGFGQTILQYVDLDAGGGLLDYNCGATTYDGHNGLDVEIPNFFAMDEGVPVKAAAPGIVSAAHDGEFDRQTVWIPGAPANYVIVQQTDGSFAYYFHFRKGSVAVSVGQPVATGQVLGMVGSSGFSNIPHLHFETWDGARVDPFTGACQGGPSWWAAQKPYVWTLPFQLWDSGITTLAIDWPTMLEKPPVKTHFRAASLPTLKGWARLRNVQVGDQITFNWYRNSLLQTGSSTFTVGTAYTSSWWWASKAASSTGTWRLDILRNGALLAQHYITVDAIANQPATIARKVFELDVDTPLDDQFLGVDPDGSVFWYRIATPPLHGTLSQYAGRARKFRYTPNPGFIGVDSVGVYTLDDENLTGPTSYYVFSVGGLLDAPVARAGIERLRAPRPNPMARGGEFAYALPAPARVRLVLRDVGGRTVRLLDDGERAAGEHRVHWDGRDADGRAAAAGVYFATLETPEGAETRRVVSVR